MALHLGELAGPRGSTRRRRRVGRGPGSGLGKTCGKGHKGHKVRAGYRRKAYHEGGQMPLYRKVPKRGFTNPTRRAYEALNLKRLATPDIDEWTRELLVKHRLVSSRSSLYKVLGTGEVERALVIHAHAFSRTAREKIERAGGRCEVIA